MKETRPPKPSPIAESHRSLLTRAKRFSSATIVESCPQHLALPFGIKPIVRSMKLCGPAVPVSSPPADNLWLHRAIYRARPGDVLVVHTSGFVEAGYWGEIMTRAAVEKSLGGLVIDGCVRDCEQLAKINFPVFSRGVCIRGTTKNALSPGSVNQTIRVGQVIIAAGDLVVGDADGVAVVPWSSLAKTLDNASAWQQQEKRILRKLQRGATTIQLLNLAE
ncbi:MAG TPA: RraA family protein [Candidatus Dormibacteraeota bacterium]|jgi:4-hydroxy-4-methyl-2-oxoglutarate aldolase|nr:RraA family protein [Candidatus Dormibacteraeota bacterium]